MCGICGELVLDGSRPARPERIRAMLAALVHRGPDDEGVFCQGPVGLGIRRLAIIDLAGGHQPIASEDGSKTVVFNGEIYNYVELRRDLQARGHRFATASDTETIVHLYEEKGERCVDDLNGMFAFALWDATEGRLLLARDRLGIKPLHYAALGGTLLFASELGALMVHPDVPRDLDLEAVDDYLTCFYIPGTRSVYRAIRKLPPAHTAVWRGGRETQSRYWQVRYAPPAAPKPLEHYAEAYREHLQRAVRLQLRSDVPLGVFLSGGLDSGSLVAAISRVTGRPPQTFTVGFEDASYDESAPARATAARYGTEHHEVRFGPDDLRRSGDLIEHFGEPFGPFTNVQAYVLARRSRRDITVALAGDGGDELFGGYPTYVASRLARWYLRVPAALRRGVFQRLARRLPVSDGLLSLDFKIREFIRGAELFERGGNMAWKVIFTDAEKRDLLADDVREALAGHDALAHARACQEAPAGATDLQRAMHGDLAMFLPDSILTQTDRMSMAVSLEVRVPILDHELVEFAAAVPDACKVRGARTKILVREALKDWLPPEVLARPKTGFTTPVPIWIRGPLKDYVLDTLAPAALARTGFFNPPAVARLLEEHMAGRADHARRIWTLVQFVLWHERCYRGRHRAGGAAAPAEA